MWLLLFVIVFFLFYYAVYLLVIVRNEIFTLSVWNIRLINSIHRLRTYYFNYKSTLIRLKVGDFIFNEIGGKCERFLPVIWEKNYKSTKFTVHALNSFPGLNVLSFSTVRANKKKEIGNQIIGSFFSWKSIYPKRIYCKGKKKR